MAPAPERIRSHYPVHERLVTLIFPTVEAADEWDEAVDRLGLLDALRGLKGYEVAWVRKEAGEEAEEADGE